MEQLDSMFKHFWFDFHSYLKIISETPPCQTRDTLCPIPSAVQLPCAQYSAT